MTAHTILTARIGHREYLEQVWADHAEISTRNPNENSTAGGTPAEWSYADLDLIAGALLDAVDDYEERAAEELDESGPEAAAEWTRKSERAEALFERVCRELDRMKKAER